MNKRWRHDPGDSGQDGLAQEAGEREPAETSGVVWVRGQQPNPGLRPYQRMRWRRRNWYCLWS